MNRFLHFVSKLILSGLRLFPFIARSLNIPLGRIRSVKKWISEKKSLSPWSIRMEAPVYQKLFESSFITSIIPKKADTKSILRCPPGSTQERYVYWDRRNHHDARKGICHRDMVFYDEVFIAYLPNAVLVGPEGGVIAHTNHLVEESVWDWDNGVNKSKAMSAFRLPRPKEIKGTYYTVVSIFAEGYPHWLTEVLPRLYGLSLLSPDLKPTLIFNDELNKWQNESIKLMGFDSYPVLALKGNSYKADLLMLPSYAGLSGTPHPGACKWVRELILKNISVNEPSVRIYISRKQATKRQLVNESQVLEILLQNGFIEVLAENMSFSEQVKLFSKAEMIVAPHGAGLANLLFAPHDCKVLEILDVNYVSDYFYNLANILNQTYYYLLGSSEGIINPSNINPGRDHFKIDIEEFKLGLKTVLDGS